MDALGTLGFETALILLDTRSPPRILRAATALLPPSNDLDNYEMIKIFGLLVPSAEKRRQGNYENDLFGSDVKSMPVDCISSF